MVKNEKAKDLGRITSEVEQLFEISIPLRQIDKDFTIIRINDAYCWAFQVKKEDVVGKKCHQAWPIPNCHTDNCILKSILSGKEADSYEVQRDLPDKTRKDFLVKAGPYRDEAGNINGIVETFTDITTEKQSKEQIATINKEMQSRNEELCELLSKVKDNEETYRNLFQNAQVGLFRTRISDGKILESNQQLAAMFGYESRAEFVFEYKTSGNYVDAGTREKMVGKIKKKGSIQNFEARFYRKDGSIFWARYSARMYPEKGWIEGVAEDITEHKMAEAALHESEKKFQTLVNQAPAALFLHKMDGSIADYNHTTLKNYGYSGDEILTLKAGDIDPDYQERENAGLFWEELNKKKRIRIEARHKKKDGTIFPVEISIAPIEINNEKYYLALAADITERKKAEKDLRESEEKYRTLVNSTLQGVVIAKSDPVRLVFANPAMAGISGYSPERLIEMGADELAKLVCEEDRQMFFGNFQKRIQDGSPPQSKEYRLETRDGTIKWVALFSSRIEYQNEPATLTTFMDITKRKQAENTLNNKVDELERFHRLTVSREFAMIELKKEVNELLEKSGQPARYRIVEHPQE